MAIAAILLIPFLFGTLLLLLKPKRPALWALLAAVVELALVAQVLIQSNQSASPLQFTREWLPSAGLQFSLFVDGINGILIGLCALLIPFIVGTTWGSDKAENPQYLGLILYMQAAMMGAFLAKDAFLFYFFFEASLLPIYFILSIYGGEQRQAISLKFFIYTLFGSLFLLIGLIYLYLRTPGDVHSADFEALYQVGQSLEGPVQGYLLLAFFLAFAIKMPMFPFHTWQPDTYTMAPSQGSMLLSGIMLKMGTYGVIRLILPAFPAGLTTWADTLMMLSVIGLIYGSIIAIQQKDMKRLLAYSSFAHVGLMSAGMLSMSQEGIQGALYQMLSHGINIVGLFFVVEVIERRTKSRLLAQLGGITAQSYWLSVCFIVLSLGSVALPLTNGFVGEFLLLKSLVDHQFILGMIAGLSIVLGAVYTLRMIQKSMFGNASKISNQFQDLALSETLVLLPLAILVVLGGVFPTMILSFSQGSVELLMQWFK